MPSRSTTLRQLTTDDTERLLTWFVESYQDGWRPVMQSHINGVAGRYTPIGTHDLAKKAERLLHDVHARSPRD